MFSRTGINTGKGCFCVGEPQVEYWGQWSDPAWMFLSKDWECMSPRVLASPPFGNTNSATPNSIEPPTP